jgi:hypothetical protein
VSSTESIVSMSDSPRRRSSCEMSTSNLYADEYTSVTPRLTVKGSRRLQKPHEDYQG